MPYWAIYVCDPERFREVYGEAEASGRPPGPLPRATPGELRQVTDSPPSEGGLSVQGLGFRYFGEDAPDLEAVEWCPRRLSFVARTREGDLAGQLAVLQERIRAAEAELDRLQEPQVRAGWWERLKSRVRRAS